MTTPRFRLNPSVMSDVIWRDVLSDLDLEMAAVSARIAAAWRECEGTRGKMEYNTGSISPSAGIALYALARRLAPRTVFEVGTFIGKSTVAMALALEDADVAGATIYTCDSSNDFHLPHRGATRIVGFPRKTSTQALTEAASQGAQVDLFHLDGRLAEADLPLLARVARPDAVYAIDDFEGSEKGVANMALLRAQPALRGYVLAYPPDRQLLASFGLHSRCLTAILLPGASFGFTTQ